MKYLKTYEDINIDEPEVGDYVIVKSWSDKLSNFLNNNFGQIVRFIGSDVSIEYDENLLKKANIEFPNNQIILYRTQIKYWAKTKEELKLFLLANKYNL